MYDAAEQFFQNQNILPAQFFAGRADRGRIEPLRKLAFAVLIDAVHCFQANFGTTKHTRARQFVEAREWLLGPNGDGPFSFENVCFLVGVDGARLQESLRKWQAAKRDGLPCRTLVRRSPVNRLGSLQPRRRRRRSRAAHNAGQVSA
jgi:hypothetical protein